MLGVLSIVQPTGPEVVSEASNPREEAMSNTIECKRLYLPVENCVRVT